MGHNNREIELKLEVEGDSSLKSVSTRIQRAFDHKRAIKGKSKDYYWNPVNNLMADFVRLRVFPNKTSQLTVKHTDRGSTLDRVEIDLDTGKASNSMAFMRRLLGEPDGEITKEYEVFFLDEDSNVSIYRVCGDKRIYIEIEAKTKKRVMEIRKLIDNRIPDLKGVAVNKSLYQLFIKKD